MKRKGIHNDWSPSTAVVSSSQYNSGISTVTSISPHFSSLSLQERGDHEIASHQNWEDIMNQLIRHLDVSDASDSVTLVNECKGINNKWKGFSENIDTEASEIKEKIKSQTNVILQAQIDEERFVLQEQEKLSVLTDEMNHLSNEKAELISTIENIKERINQYIHEISQEVEDIDEVEAMKKRDVPRLQQNISLFAKSTGIVWDYNSPKESVLSGEVDVVSKGIHRRFTIDHDSLSPHEIASELWKVIEY